MSKQSEKDGFIVAYTKAWLGTWNAGRCCGLACKRNVDDIAFTHNLIANLKQKYNIDKKRIYVTGVSNGGMLSYKIGRQRLLEQNLLRTL